MNNNNAMCFYKLNEYYKYLRKLKKDLLKEIQKQENMLENNSSKTKETIKNDLLYKYIALNVITIRESKDNPFTRIQRADFNEVFPEEKDIFEFLEKIIRLSYLQSYDEILPYELEFFKLKK